MGIGTKIALSGLAAVLGWQVITRSFVAYLGGYDPELALKIRPSDPQALLNLADREIDRQRTAEHQNQQSKLNGRLGAANSVSKPATPEKTASASDVTPYSDVRLWAEAAILQEPLSARGLRLLGQVDEVSGRTIESAKLFNAATRLSLREWRAVLPTMLKAFEAGNFEHAVRLADAILRTRPMLFDAIAPTLAKIAENEKGIGIIEQLLAKSPTWRHQFFDGISSYITDARTPMHLLFRLRSSAATPLVDERAPYLRFLIEHKFYDLAYYVWLQFLPPEELSRAGLLFNGGFEFEPSGLPFNWVISQGRSVTVELIPRSDHTGGRALSIEFGNGRVDFARVTEMTMLAPGKYAVKGKYKGDVRGARGLVWRINCVMNQSQPALGESPMMLGSKPQWTDFQFSFSVPVTDCRAQQLALVLDARSPSEMLVSGSILYDDLEIVRE